MTLANNTSNTNTNNSILQNHEIFSTDKKYNTYLYERAHDTYMVCGAALYCVVLANFVLNFGKATRNLWTLLRAWSPSCQCEQLTPEAASEQAKLLCLAGTHLILKLAFLSIPSSLCNILVMIEYSGKFKYSKVKECAQIWRLYKGKLYGYSGYSSYCIARFSILPPRIWKVILQP